MEERIAALSHIMARRLAEWKMPGHMVGTVDFLSCCVAAAETQLDGEPWTPHRVAQARAQVKGCTMWAIWVRMDKALRRSAAGLPVGKAMRQLVNAAVKELQEVAP